MLATVPPPNVFPSNSPLVFGVYLSRVSVYFESRTYVFIRLLFSRLFLI